MLNFFIFIYIYGSFYYIIFLFPIQKQNVNNYIAKNKLNEYLFQLFTHCLLYIIYLLFIIFIFIYSRISTFKFKIYNEIESLKDKRLETLNFNRSNGVALLLYNTLIDGA